MSDDEEEMVRHDSFSQSTGKITGREKIALKQVDKLARELQAQGERPERARDKEFKEMRDNSRKDWRRRGY